MKQKLLNSITTRLSSELAPQNPVCFLKELPPSDCVEIAIGIVYLYTRVGHGKNKKLILLTEVISAIGHAIRNQFKLKRSSPLAAKAGAFILYSFEIIGILKLNLDRATNGHATYVIEMIDDDGLSLMWDSLKLEHTEKLPSLKPYSPWVTSLHPTGVNMVKTADRGVLTSLTPETHPMIFNLLNRAQEVGWNINEEVYSIYAWALRNKTDAFADIWEMTNPEAKASKVREAKAIGSIAKRFIGETFYHLYVLDFRGRKYVSTAYLHEQGTDLAKGLLLRADKKPITQQGFFWLCISIANNWAGDAGEGFKIDGSKTDKIPLNDRVNWTLDNEEILMSYVASPKVNQGWMSAEKPWQFLAACFEFKKFRDWQISTQIYCLSNNLEYDEFGYESGLEAFIDGSNNGSQHLSALTRDEITAPYVNLTPSDMPGDLYAYVADHIWQALSEDLSKMSKEDIKKCNNFIDTLYDMKTQISAAPLKSDRRAELIKEVIAYKKEHEDLLRPSNTVFWSRITDKKHKRKIVKR
jgi:DNA-directed RNA polymerase